jgi:hypothetical protein
MSRFYATIRGARGEASRTGTRGSGITGHVRGWDVGARVRIYEGPDGEDVVEVYRTGGSRGAESDRLIARFTEAEGA